MDAAPLLPHRKLHFSGIGGIGMVAAARLAVEAGFEVRGSDNPLYPPASELVAALGVTVYEGYSGRNLDWNPDLVIVGNALSRGNDEVEGMLERNLPYVSMSEWLKFSVLQQRRPIAVCGTHGKTTTTLALAHILRSVYADAGYLAGGQPVDLPHSSELGAPGGRFVVEGDEYDSAFFDKRAKFLHYLPQIAIVTSLEFDHADIYRDLEEIRVAFQRMLRQVPRSGWLLACHDDAGAMSLVPDAPCRKITFGFHADADAHIARRESTAGRQQVAVQFRGKDWIAFETVLPGAYNVRNLVAAAVTAHLCDVDADDIIAALASYRGVKRRMETFHNWGEVTFVEDFAHHPTAVSEAIAAAREHWPDARLVVAFEPRTNTTTTNRYADALRDAFAQADEVLLGPIYRPERIPDSERLDRAALARDVTGSGASCAACDSAEHIVKHLRNGLDSDTETVVLVLSNGAFDEIYGKIREAF